MGARLPGPAAAAPSLHGWVPVHAALRAGTLQVELCRVGGRRFVEPFFEDSIAACMRLPFHSVFRHRLDADAMGRWLERHPGLPPSGFVFHLSRCGSTLVSQLLAALPSCRVISEAGPIDAALRAGNGDASIDETTRIAWLRAMVGMLGQPGRAEERRYFVKFDSWHANLLPLILRAYPDVPWLFLIRDPVEVIVSHLRRPGAQMVPGMLGYAPPGVDFAGAALLPREQYCARMLGAICDAVGRVFAAGAPRGRLLDYRDLAGAVDTLVLPHFGIDPDAAERDAIAAALLQDAKSPAFAFRADGAGKQREASAAVREAAEAWAMPAYRRLLARAAA